MNFQKKLQLQETPEGIFDIGFPNSFVLHTNNPCVLALWYADKLEATQWNTNDLGPIGTIIQWRKYLLARSLDGTVKIIVVEPNEGFVQTKQV